MTITERSVGDVTIMDIEGRITVQDGADQFRDAVRQLVHRGRLKLVVNLAAVPYIDSTAMGQIVRAYTTATRLGGGFKLLHVTVRVREILVVTKLRSVFDLFDVETEAVDSFGSARV